MKFEWDARKAETNQRTKGLCFEEAITAFDDPSALLADDEKHSTTKEKRKWLIGESDIGVIVVVFTKRRNNVRIISARKANAQERLLYENYR